MSDLDDSVRQTREFIDEAQQVIAKTNDMLAALNRLIAKNSDARSHDPKRIARNAQLEQDLEALVLRYLAAPDASSATPQQSQIEKSNPTDSVPVRPGRFRPRI